MAEEAFQQQEQRRLLMEDKKKALLAKTPIPGSLEEFMVKFKTELSENPLLKEYLEREHTEVKELLDYLNRVVQEQKIDVNALNSEITTLRGEINELCDNFNLYANKTLEEHRLHRERVAKTCEALEKELSY